ILLMKPKRNISNPESRHLEADLARLDKMAFGRLKHCGPLLKRFHALKHHIDATGRAESVWRLYDWLLVPFMLWPQEFEGMTKELLDWLETGKPVDERFWFLLEHL